jgi:hypothetical protein
MPHGRSGSKNARPQDPGLRRTFRQCQLLTGQEEVPYCVVTEQDLLDGGDGRQFVVGRGATGRAFGAGVPGLAAPGRTPGARFMESAESLLVEFEAARWRIPGQVNESTRVNSVGAGAGCAAGWGDEPTGSMATARRRP